MRTLISAPTTWYVDNVAGSDANDGSTAALAFQHINFAIAYLRDGFDFAAQPTIQLVTTGVDYAENVVLPRYCGSLGWNGWATSYSYPKIQGDVTNNAAVCVHPATGTCFTSVNGLPWIIDSICVKSSNQWGVNFDACGHVLVHNMNFGNCGLGHMGGGYGAFLETLNGPYTISGSAQNHLCVGPRGIYVSQGNPITFLGNPQFVYFARGYQGALVDCSGMSLAPGSGGCTSYHPGVASNDGTALMYPTSNGGWP